MNSFTWIIWLIAVLGAFSATRNPLHLLLILLILAFMLEKMNVNSHKGNTYQISFFPFVVIMVAMTTIFNALISHVGTTVLITIPGNFILLSGPITLEAIIYGATNGLELSGIFLSFAIFNQSLSTKSIIRLIPKAFYPLALIISIAINFLPTIQRRIDEIRQAQTIRGNQFHHIKDYTNLFLPLLIDSLERSMQLAEAMTARGFIPHPPNQGSNKHRFILFSGLIIFTFGWILQLIGGNRFSFGISMAGVAVIFWGFWQNGRKIPQSAFKRESWRLQDWFISVAMIFILCSYTLPLSILDHQILQYTPYPTVTLPDFNLLVGLFSLVLLTPAFLQKRTPP